MPNENENLDSLNEEGVRMPEENLETAEEKAVREAEEQEEQRAIEEIEDAEVLKEKNRQLFARAKKAEVELRKLKVSAKPKPKMSASQDNGDGGDVESVIGKVLDKRELESLEMSDELKKEVQTYAKVQGVSVQKALTSNYISFLKEKEEKKKRAENASLGTRGKGITKKDYVDAKATDFDLTTPEGKADFAKYEDFLRKKLG